MNMKHFALATTALVGGLMVASGASAQSTASQATEVDKVVVTASGQRAVSGLIAETAPKSKSSINQEYIDKQQAGQTILDTLNQTPGLSFTNSDAFGSSGGNVRLRGFDGNRISLTFDGIPLNDTGNYAIYTNQQLDGELISRASVNMGTTDVDSPTASAVGGTINYVTLTPTNDFSGMARASVGSDNYRRVFAMLNSGEFGPFGTKAWVAGSYQKYDKFKGPGSLEKKQFNARIYQSLANGDFASLAFHYNENRNNNYRAVTLAEYRAFGEDFDFTATCTNRTLNTATATITETAPAIPGNCVDFAGRQVNPSNTGNIRGQFLHHISDSLRVTFDPSFQYTLADGGGQLGTMSETDGRVRGTSTVGKDLNGDGDTADTVAFFTPSVTNTRRYGVTSSLIWDINDRQRLRVAYTGDFGYHRQTGEYTTLNADGTTTNVFGGKDGHGAKVFGSDGSFLRGRDRLSKAFLNQVAFEYRGEYFDDKLTVVAGLRMPYFKRELNQFCYSQDGSSNVRCTSEAPNATLANGNVTFAGSTTQFIKPYEATKKYDDVLPNIGLNYQLADRQYLYGSYAEGLSAPRTDSLYTVKRLANGSVVNPGVQPETTQAFDIGYRYQTPDLVAQVALWTNKFQNRIVSAYDDELGIFVDRNVGDAKGYGLDANASWRLEEYLSVFGSFSYNHSELKQNIPLNGQVLPTKGKFFVETPEYTFGGGFDWNITEALRLSMDLKYTGERWSTDVNDEKTPAYTITNVSIRYDMPFAEKTYLQLNVKNLFDEDYFGNISTRNNAVTITGVQNGSAPTYAVGFPRTLQLSLTTRF
ncbi:TonB-dependent receptor [Caulobacter vibrioides]|uniref:TonB-dependent receptor n=1 Tax=Caulobacter vibrioides TaxID=155892 RepID=A0A290N1K3_CAUVI|nr:TonB-dependent receptor [Caulobacter vibrioides]ATC34582.1 TonB-dependent receptor [Caulobacter vibrioides]